MTATAAQIAQIRRMVAEPTAATYSDALIQGFIETYPLLDERGEAPYTFSSATPPAQVVNTAWIATYDLHAAAADIWSEKASNFAALYQFSADGGSYSRNQAYEQMMTSARYHASRRATKTMTAIKWPKETSADRFPWIANLAEPTDP
jgi:hypothetical protein